MTQHSTRAAKPPPGNSLWGRLLKRPWPAQLVLVAALLLAVPFLFHAGSTVHAADNEITGVTLTSPNPGELAITWEAPNRAPGDYRVTWKKSDGKWPSYKDDNTVEGGNAFPTGTSHTVSDLEEGTEYSVRVRARYHDGGGNITESGPWSDPPAGLTIAGLPDKPTGLSTSPSHDSVVLAWTDPNDNSITGYQVLRGPDAANLAVLTADTGSAASSYTDDTVEAQTTYLYATKARNAQGLGPQSDPVSVTTPAAPAPPAKPTGISYGASHNNVLLLWTDPGDDSITGYQVLRGDDAGSLAVLTDDTGSTDASYSDDTVEAETEYFYAIRARNAQGLGPQSDTASVTTQEAPEEPVTEEQVAGVDFIIAGQMMDTTGTCSETDIAQIADGCTHNTTNPTPQFGVVGTLGSNAGVQVSIGRNLAGAFGSQVADQSDLQGLNKRINPTFQPGRNLLEIFGDEDTTISGGGETHYFRINVVPYWELNGERLSKDSDCQSTTGRTAAQITDSDCILTTFNPAELRLYNVINEHYNVYVDVNGSNVISEPDDTALAKPFTLGLVDGENVLRVRLASRGGNVGETYGSNAFYYKVTGTDFLVSNLGQTGDVTNINTERQIATQFTTGGNTSGYTISEVRIPISVSTTAVTPVVSIYSDVSGSPGASIKTLGNPSITVSSSTAPEAEFDAEDYKLNASTPYWIVVENPHASLIARTSTTAEDSEDAGGAPGWSIGNDSKLRPIGGTFSNVGAGLVMQIGIKGELVTVSTDATLSSLEILPSSRTAAALNPTFSPEITDYTLTVENEHTSTEIYAGSNDENSMIEFLDKDDTTIPPASTDVGAAWLIPNLDVGENIFKIKVTAEDTTTTKTYQVTITRSEPAVTTAPDAPASLSASAGDTEVDLTWTEPASDGGAAITKYQYRVSVDDGTTWSPDWTDVPDGSDTGTDQGDERTVTVTGLTNGTLHTFQVRAVNSEGSGSEAQATAAPIGAPGAPASLTATPGNTQATLAWTPPASDGGAAITKYQYRVSVDGGTTWSPDWTDVPDSDSDSDQADERSVTITGLTNGTLHTFQVRAVNSEGSGSEAQATATPAAQGSTTLTALVLKDASANTITINPTFAYDVESYNATVANSVDQITVEPTKFDNTSTIKYLDSNDMELTDADATTTGVFDVDLAEGENVIKVEVTSSDAMTKTTYQVTVTRVDFLVSNLGQTDFGNFGVNSSRPALGVKFTTGSTAGGYKIDSVPLVVSAPSGTIPEVSIYSDNSGEPGSSIKVLKNPSNIPTSLGPKRNFDAADYQLDPSTSYWIVIERRSGTDQISVRITGDTEEDPGSAPGWNIGDRAAAFDSASWTSSTTSTLKLAIKGEPITPVITLAADFDSIIRELHDVTLTLTRTGSTAEVAPITLYVENAAGSSVITSSPRTQTMTFGIGMDTLEFTVPQDWITRLEAGNFLASVEAGSEYDLSDASTSVEVLFPSTTLMEVRLDQNTYEVTEGDTLSFNVLFNVLQKIEAPNKVFNYITVRHNAETATTPEDYTILSVFASIPPSSWSLVADRYSATFPVTLETLDDALYERPMGAQEGLEIETFESFLTPSWVTRKGPATGTTRYPVTIIDNETLNLSAELSSTGLTTSANLRIDEDAGQTVTLTVTNTDLASDGNPVTLPPGVKLKITPDIPTNRGATETDDWTISPVEIDLGGTATITIIDDMLEEGPESVTFEVGFDDDAAFQAARATLTINDDEYTGPALQSAELNGAILTLEFSNSLDATSRPAATSFTVKVDGTAVSLASSNPVSISGSTVTLRLRSAVPAGDTVTVSYTEPGANPIQDTSSLVAASFTDEPVSNDDRIASIEAVKSPILEGEEEVQFRITLSREPPAGGVDVMVELAPFAEYLYGQPVSVNDYRTHNVHIGQGQTEAILEILTTRDEIVSNTKAVTATLLPNTGYTVGSNSEGTVLVNDPDQVNVRFVDGCGQTITVAEGDGEASFDIVLDNPVSFKFSLVITLINGLADSGNDFSGGIQILQFDHLQTRITVTVPILEDTQLENTEGFQVWILRNGLDPAILTPTCGKSNPHLTIEITDNDTAKIVLDAPEEVIEGQPIKLGLGPRPNVLCPVQFPFTTTLTITGDTDALQDSPGTSLPLRVPNCGDPEGVKIYYDFETQSDPVWQTIDDPGPRGDRQVTFTIGPLMSSDSRVSKLILDRTSATVTIQNKPNRQPTGRPTLSGTDQVGHTLTASTSGIDDQDGLTSPGYTYQWQQQDGGVFTNITGADQMVYTLSTDDEGKRVRVQVTLTDDDRNIHTLESAPTGLVQAQTRVPAGKVKVSLGATAYVVEEGESIQITVTLAEAPEDQHVHISFTVTPENGATQADFTAGSTFTRQLRYDVGDTTDRIKIRADDDTVNDDGETITLCLDDLPEPYATLAGLDCATINILDNDDPNSVQVSFSRGNYWASEDGNPAWPRISVHPVPDREITIPITITRGGGLSAADHGAVTTRVTFGPGLYGVHGDGHLSDDRTYASFPIEIWAIDDRDDDDGEYLDLAFGQMPDAFVTEDTGYRLGGDSRAGFRRPANKSRVWFNDNEFTEVEVTDSTNHALTRRMRVTFADAELEAKEGLYEIGTVATVRVQLSRPRNKESTVTIPITVTRHGTATAADYAGAGIPSSITFLPGQTEYSFRVRAVNDDIDDDGEYLTLSFGTLPELVDSGDQASVRIDLDDDDPPVEVFFEHANYEVTSVSQDENTEYARLNVKVKLSAAPERFIDVGIVPESIQGDGHIHFEYSAYIPRGPHDGAHFYTEDTEFTLRIYISARGGFDPNQTYRLTFDGMSYKMLAGSPATATITIDPTQTSEPASRDWPADTTTRAVLALNQCVDGRIDPAGDVDWIKVSLQAGQGYAFNILQKRNDGSIARLKVYDHAGLNPVTLSDSSNQNDGYFREFYRAEADGVRYIEIQFASTTGGYRHCLGRDDHGSAHVTATRIKVDEHVTGSIWQEGERGPTIRDADSFRVSLVANRTYRLEVQGTGENGVDVGGTLADPQFTLARFIGFDISPFQGLGGDEGTGKNESYTFTATHTTDYYIEVYDGASPDEGGTYTVIVQDVT